MSKIKTKKPLEKFHLTAVIKGQLFMIKKQVRRINTKKKNIQGNY